MRGKKKIITKIEFRKRTNTYLIVKSDDSGDYESAQTDHLGRRELAWIQRNHRTRQETPYAITWFIDLSVFPSNHCPFCQWRKEGPDAFGCAAPFPIGDCEHYKRNHDLT